MTVESERRANKVMFGLLTGHIHTHKQIKKKCQGGVKCAKLHPCTDTAPLSVVHTDTMKHTIVLHTHTCTGSFPPLRPSVSSGSALHW